MTQLLDQTITEDFAALASDSKKDLPGLEEMLPASAGAYRDNRPGAEARRDSLLSARRLELAMMPLAFQRTFVRRVSRAAAGGIGALAALTVGVTIADPFLANLARLLIPELNLTVMSLGVGVSILVAYVVGGWIAEWIYERRMSETLRTTGEAFADLDALAQGPMQEARRLVRDMEGYSVGLPLVAAAALLPMFALLSLVYGPYWAVSDLTGNLGFLALGVIGAVAGAVVLARACVREHSQPVRSRLLAVCGHWTIVPAAFALGLVVLFVLGQAVLGASSHGIMPSHAVRGFLALGGTLAAFAPFAWIALLLRRRENARIETDAPGNQ